MSTRTSLSPHSIFTIFCALALVVFFGSACQLGGGGGEVDCAEQCPCNCEDSDDDDDDDDNDSDDLETMKKDSKTPYPVVLVGNVKINEGKIPKKSVQARLNKSRFSLRQCYEPALKENAELRGEMDVQFTVSAKTGKVIAALVRESTLKNKTVEKCVSDKVKGWTFEKHKGKESVIRFSSVMIGVSL